MRSFIIVLITCTTLMGSFVSALDEEDRAVYDKVVECISVGFHADRPEEHVPMATAFCDAFKANYPCITKPFDFKSDSTMLDFYRAFQLLHIYLLDKVNMCEEQLPFKGLKDLVEKSGILKKEDLKSIEDDQYVPCQGDLMKKCFKADYEAWEAHRNVLDVYLIYIDCYKNEAPNCNSRIAQHMNAISQAFKKHLEEKHGLFGGMVKGIEH